MSQTDSQLSQQQAHPRFHGGSPTSLELPISQIDAFTREVFGGNPAAVVHLPHWLSDASLQAIAAENNLSETAYLVGEIPGDAPTPPSDSPAHHLRWFTPTVEIDLCGHATLASAAQLFLAHDESAGPLERLEFWTRSGWLTVTLSPTGAGTEDSGAGDSGDESAPAGTTGSPGLLTLDFPADPPSLYDDPATPPGGSGLPDAATVGKALGIDPGHIVELGEGSSALFCVVDSPALVRDMAPDFAAVAAIHGHGIIVTADAAGGTADGASAEASDDAAGGTADGSAGDFAGYDVVSRFFAPAIGIDEDPVTGSAHTVLGPYWMGRLGRDRLACHQASARGGELILDAAGERILISGHAVRYLTGTITAPRER